MFTTKTAGLLFNIFSLKDVSNKKSKEKKARENVSVKGLGISESLSTYTDHELDDKTLLNGMTVQSQYEKKPKIIGYVTINYELSSVQPFEGFSLVRGSLKKRLSSIKHS